MFFALILAAIAIAIPLFDPLVKDNRKLKQAIILILIAHQVTSALQVALNGLPTMKMDPLAFHAFGLWGEGRLSNNPYAQFLHFCYQLLAPSHLLGCEISNIFFSLALLVELRFFKYLGYQKILPQLILIFGLLPSCILNTSVTLREAAQMAGYISICFLLVRICRQGIKPESFLIIPVSAALILLHQGIAALLIVILPISLAFALQARPGVMIALLIIALSGGVLVKDRLFNSLVESSAVVEHLSEGNTEYLENYAQNVGESRTSFGVSLDLSSLGNALKTGPLVLFYYLFSPLPWQLRGLLDLYGFFETIIRISLFVGAFLAIKNSEGTKRRELLLLAFLFLTVEAGWAIGTANWGTAFRHRLVGWGLLVALGGPYLVQKATNTNSASFAEPSSQLKQLSIRERRRRLNNKKMRQL